MTADEKCSAVVAAVCLPLGIGLLLAAHAPRSYHRPHRGVDPARGSFRPSKRKRPRILRPGKTARKHPERQAAHRA